MAYLCYSTFVLLDTKYLQKYRVKIRIWICDNLPDCFLWKTQIYNTESTSCENTAQNFDVISKTVLNASGSSCIEVQCQQKSCVTASHLPFVLTR